MAKRIATAILMCAVMALVALVPLVSAEITIIKGPQGPRASAMTWSYEAADYGIWKAQLDNHGLRSLVIDVADNTSGAPELLLHQRIRFAAYDAYPTGVISSEAVSMAPGRLYEITATPNGPRDSYVIINDLFTMTHPPVALFTATTPDYRTANVDATTSYDPYADGFIAEYVWEWGDGAVGSGMTASHVYAMAGTYDITLTVVDNLGGSDSAVQSVTVTAPPVEDYPPVAAFTVSVSGLTVSVDASGSSDDHGITDYAWSWGDGTTGNGMTATHTYSGPGAQAMLSTESISIAAEPVPPYYVAGYTLNSMGTAVPSCTVTILNHRTGASLVTTSDSYGFYMVDIANQMTGGYLAGDIVNITAVNGNMIGWSEAALLAGSYTQIDVVLSGPELPPFDVVITLTVTDAMGQTDSVSMTVTLYP